MTPKIRHHTRKTHILRAQHLRQPRDTVTRHVFEPLTSPGLKPQLVGQGCRAAARGCAGQWHHSAPPAERSALELVSSLTRRTLLETLLKTREKKPSSGFQRRLQLSKRRHPLIMTQLGKSLATSVPLLLPQFPQSVQAADRQQGRRLMENTGRMCGFPPAATCPQRSAQETIH